MSSRSLSIWWKKKNSLFAMGSIVLYIIEWAFALLLLLTLYKAVFSGTTFYRFNRFYLLGATLLSAHLPLLHFTVSDDTSVVKEIAISGTVFARQLTGVNGLMGPEITVTPDAPQAAYVFNTVDLHFVRERREAELADDDHRRLMALMTEVLVEDSVTSAFQGCLF